MALVVEDGTQVPGANSYATLEEFRAYLSARRIEPDLDPEDLEARLIIAASYLNARYGHRFEGRKVSRDQPMPFPREGLDDLDGYRYDHDDIPSGIITAQLELAIRALSRNLTDDVLPEANIKRRRERIEGVYEEETEFVTGTSSSSPTPVYTEVDNILAPFLKNNGSTQVDWELVRG